MRRLLAGLAGLAAALGLMSVPAGPAEATGNPLRNLMTVESSGPNGATSVFCPVGKVVIGGGFRSGTALASPGRRLGGFKPTLAVNSQGKLIHGFSLYAVSSSSSGTLPVTVQARCADAPDGYEVIRRWSSKNTEWEKAVDATCPTGKVVIGAGADVTNSVAGIDEILPFTNKVHVKAFGGPGPNAWDVGAFAICSWPLNHRSMVNTGVATSRPDGTTFSRSTCPPGSVPISAAFDLQESLGRAGAIEASFDPNWGLGVTARAREVFPISSLWRSVAYAVCGA